jgi:hypothetical protein
MRRHYKDLRGLLGGGQVWCAGEGAGGEGAGARARFGSPVCACADRADEPAAAEGTAVAQLPRGGALVRGWLEGLGSRQQWVGALAALAGSAGGGRGAPLGCPEPPPPPPPAANASAPPPPPPPPPPCPAAVVVSAGMWDAAWQTLRHFEREAAAFFPALLRAYPDARTLLVVRTPNHQCCGPPGPFGGQAGGANYASSGRVAAVAGAWARAAARHLRASGRLRVWDVYALGGARSFNGSARARAACTFPHEAAEDVALGGQVLLNALCGHEWGELPALEGEEAGAEGG